jgi:hypothetical protein
MREAAMFGTFARSGVTQTLHLAQPNSFPSHLRDRAILADDCTASS